MHFLRIAPYGMPAVLGAFGILFFATSIFMTSGFLGYRETTEANQRARADAMHAAEERHAAAREAIRAALAADTIEVWERAAAVVLAVDDPRLRDVLLGTILPKHVLAVSTARDRLVADAFDLGMRDPDDPKIKELLDRAKLLQERALELVKDLDARSTVMREALPREEWKRWEATMRYLEGYTHYARLPFLSSDEQTKANAAIQAALRSYAQIFGIYPGNERTEYAIESLYQVAEKQGNSSGQQQSGHAKRPLLLSRPSGQSTTAQDQSGI